ncbi:MAG: glutathione S-transferase family protein [Hyphomicrobiaceae bacterium]
MSGPTDRGHLVLWGVGTSRTLRAHWALAELELAYETRAIGPRTGETKTAEYTALTARQKVPLLQDGDLVITESAAIIAYLSDAYATAHNALLPRTPQSRAKCLEWIAFGLSELDAASLYVIRRHRDLAHIYGAAPDVCVAAEQYFGLQMRSLDRALGDGRTFIADNRFSAADIILGTCLGWADRYGLEVSPLARDYLAALQSRAAFGRAVARNTRPEAVPTRGDATL